jgi:hypothetical protein
MSWPDALSVESESGGWTYATIPRLPTSYFQKGFASFLLTVEVRKDGAIYVVTGTANTNLAAMSPQPPGFPIRPDRRH